MENVQHWMYTHANLIPWCSLSSQGGGGIILIISTRKTVAEIPKSYVDPPMSILVTDLT